MKRMRKEKKKGFRPLTRGLKLDRGRKRDWKKDFGEKERFGLREKREVSRHLSLKRFGLYPNIHRKMQLDRLIRYRASIDNKNLIDREVSMAKRS